MNDDKERIECDMAGQPGHTYCGMCQTCNKPRFVCGHMAGGR